MSPYKRSDSPVFYIDVRWRGYPRLRLSTDTTNKRRAADMERTLYQLRRAGRRDILELLATRRLKLRDVHDTYTKDPGELEHLRAKADSPVLGPLIDRWLAWLASPAGVSPRTRRRYSRGTIVQYRRSWNGFFATLPQGREASIVDLTSGMVSAYRRDRVRAVGGNKRRTVVGRPLSGATLNRDLAALGAFLTWCREVEGMTILRPKIPREKESSGRMRWLSADELRAFREHCPPQWWVFFAVLFYAGPRLSEVQGLRGADVRLRERRILLHEENRRLKSTDSTRDLPTSPPLLVPLGAHLNTLEPGPDDLVFPGVFQHYPTVRRVWRQVCEAAGIAGATIHDARHTFGVHAAQAGIPIVRLQKLMGHATPQMTMRYMQHAPGAYLDQDAAAIGASMEAVSDREAEARAIASLGIA